LEVSLHKFFKDGYDALQAAFYRQNGCAQLGGAAQQVEKYHNEYYSNNAEYAKINPERPVMRNKAGDAKPDQYQYTAAYFKTQGAFEVISNRRRFFIEYLADIPVSNACMIGSELAFQLVFQFI